MRFGCGDLVPDGLNHEVVIFGQVLEVIVLAKADLRERAVPEAIHRLAELEKGTGDPVTHEKTHKEGHQHETDLHQGEPEEHVLPGFLKVRNHRPVRIGAEVLQKPVVKLRNEHRIDNAKHK